MSDAKQKFTTISISDLQDELIIRWGMEPNQAAREAREQFPKEVARLLHEGWEIITQDSERVHLRKKGK